MSYACSFFLSHVKQKRDDLVDYVQFSNLTNGILL